MQIGLIFGAMAVLLVAVTLWLVSVPFTYSEIDLNQDGWLGFSEIMYSFDHGIRNVIIDDESCKEYYALKDGLPLKVVCGEQQF